MFHVKAQNSRIIYEWEKKNKSQLPYFIDEKTEADHIHFNSNLFSKHHLCPWVTDFSSITCFHTVSLTTLKTPVCSQCRVFGYGLFYMCPSKGLSGPGWEFPFVIPKPGVFF